MINCIKQFNDYELVRRCFKCRIVQWKKKTHKESTTEDGYNSECKFSCSKLYNKKRDRLINYPKEFDS